VIVRSGFGMHSAPWICLLRLARGITVDGSPLQLIHAGAGSAAMQMLQWSRYLRPRASPWPTGEWTAAQGGRGVGDGGGLSLGAKLRHSLSWEKACGGTLRTNGTNANGAELQKFDCNQTSDVFLIKTAEAKVRTHQLVDR